MTCAMAWCYKAHGRFVRSDQRAGGLVLTGQGPRPTKGDSMSLIIPIIITVVLFAALGLKIYYIVAIYRLRLRIYNEYMAAEKKRGML